MIETICPTEYRSKSSGPNYHHPQNVLWPFTRRLQQMKCRDGDRTYVEGIVDYLITIQSHCDQSSTLSLHSDLLRLTYTAYVFGILPLRRVVCWIVLCIAHLPHIRTMARSAYKSL